MHADFRRHRGSVLLLAAVLLTTGCASLSLRPRHGGALASASPQTPLHALEDTALASQPEASAPGASIDNPNEPWPLLYRRTPTQSRGAAWGEMAPLKVVDAGSAPCGERPAGWPRLDSEEEVLAPFLECTSPAAFVALQRMVDMPRLVESLTTWNAVRLGALGPLDAQAARILQQKRADFLVTATERYGLPRAEVFALFVLHTTFDDELREVLRFLANDRQLKTTLGHMGVVREELRRRGMALPDFPERDFRAGDVGRGLGRAADDALGSIDVVNKGLGMVLSHQAQQLPPPYRAAYEEVEQAQYLGAWAPANVTLGAFDHLTFGVPVGFYHLVAGTAQGAASVAQGEYEEATRQLAPSALMLGLYAGGKGVRALREAAPPEGSRLQAVVSRLESLKARLGERALGGLSRYLQQNREGALLVAEWGEAGALALHETGGNTGRALALLTEAARDTAPTRGGGGKRPGGKTGLSRGPGGDPLEALRARLRQAEWEDTGARLPRDVEHLKQHAPALDAPPSGVLQGSFMWSEYVKYWERRLGEIREDLNVKGPLKFEGYLKMRGEFARGLAFERTMLSLLEADAALPPAQRQWLQDFNQPRIEMHVGVMKADLRFADLLVIENQPTAGQPPRVETFSTKSRDLSQLKREDLRTQMIGDAKLALRYYGETLKIRRPGMEMEVQVQRIRLIYEGGKLKPVNLSVLESAMESAKTTVKGVEVSFQ
ncbi:hypothetical protein D7Y13_22005 [Corallococcus praedator]|uniref:Uncharacterized protein n=1 Tax=Corallococcus praedator TaxID=2316724 RepID=A0ABX9QEF8_9BACT|nr:MULTISPECIES: hypothetical protein [Corallococcus]RKH32721.1 hypothetical protein D7X75_14680 [Corallococcus sp. CA031C]RKI05675.1 hypothetical protein D7Y13_22005 [Corallococcus praedator]